VLVTTIDANASATTSNKQKASKVVGEQPKALKDLNKQEAGRKSAAVRQQMLDTLAAELINAKEAVFSENNKEHTAQPFRLRKRTLLKF